jgi:hypothetical protein
MTGRRGWTRCGAIGGHILPFEAWHRIAHWLSESSAVDLLSFQGVCRAASDAVARVMLERHASLRSGFGTRTFVLDPDLIERTVLVHVVPPRGDSLFAIAESQIHSEDEIIHVTEEAEFRGDHVQGFDIVWIKDGKIIQTPLRIPGLPPPASVSNIQFSPDGRHVAMLVALDTGSAWMGELDPIGRLNGKHALTSGIQGREGHSHDDVDDNELVDLEETAFIPSDECALVIVEMREDAKGDPDDIAIHVFAHAFVPEYGFDMRWQKSQLGCLEVATPELAFAGVLHAQKFVALYMARWGRYSTSTEACFHFIGCLPDIAQELIEDKRDAMRVCDSTRITSRIELSEDLKTIFFDTSAKFGVVRINDIVDMNGPCYIGQSLGIYHSSPTAVPFDRTPTLPSTRQSMRARLSTRASFPAWSSRSPTSNPVSKGRTASAIKLVSPRIEKMQNLLKNALPWRRWISIKARSSNTDSALEENRAAMDRTSPSELSQKVTHGEVSTGIASALRRFLRSPGEPRPLRLAEASGPIPWYELPEYSRSPPNSSYVPVAIAGSHGKEAVETVSTNHSSEGRQPSGLIPFGSSPRMLNFGSDAGTNKRQSTIDSSDVPLFQLPSSADKKQSFTTSPSTTICASLCSARNDRTPGIKVTIQSPPRVSCPRVPQRASLSRRIAFNKSSFTLQSPRVTCMSPDGKKICSVYTSKLASGPGEPPSHMTCVEVRSTDDGSVVFRHCRTSLTEFPSADQGHRVRFEKTFEVIAHTCGFSQDSSFVWVRDAYISNHLCVFTRRLPTIFRAHDGAVVRTFSEDISTYKHLQMAPDGCSMYGTRYEEGSSPRKGYVLVDAIDVISGERVATEMVAGPMACPELFNPQAAYLTSRSVVRGISRGNVDALWECTRGGVGCHWSFYPDNAIMM